MKYLMAIIIVLFANASNADDCQYLGNWTNCGTRDSNEWRYDYQQQMRDQEQKRQQDQIKRMQQEQEEKTRQLEWQLNQDYRQW